MPPIYHGSQCQIEARTDQPRNFEHEPTRDGDGDIRAKGHAFRSPESRDRVDKCEDGCQQVEDDTFVTAQGCHGPLGPIQSGRRHHPPGHDDADDVGDYGEAKCLAKSKLAGYQGGDWAC